MQQSVWRRLNQQRIDINGNYCIWTVEFSLVWKRYWPLYSPNIYCKRQHQFEPALPFFIMIICYSSLILLKKSVHWALNIVGIVQHKQWALTTPNLIWRKWWLVHSSRPVLYIFCFYFYFLVVVVIQTNAYVGHSATEEWLKQFLKNVYFFICVHISLALSSIYACSLWLLFPWIYA